MLQLNRQPVIIRQTGKKGSLKTRIAPILAKALREKREEVGHTLKFRKYYAK